MDISSLIFRNSLDCCKSPVVTLWMCCGYYEGTRVCPLIPFMNINRVLDKGMSSN